MNLNGLKYHYLDEGHGDPILMLHGNPTWSFYYRALVKALSQSFRTIVPDHIGCGLSEKPSVKQYDYGLKSRVSDLESFIEHLNLRRRITLVLHDWGGIIGMAYALRYPVRIGRIVLLNTAAFLPPNGKRLPIRLRLIRNFRPFSTAAVLGLNLFCHGALFMASHKKLSRDVKSALTAPYNSWRNRIATLKFVQDIPLKPEDTSYGIVKHVDENLHLLANKPVLICWGKRDFVFDNDYLAEWQRRFPDAEVHTFPDAGHYVLEDVPEKIIPLAYEFLNTHPLKI